MLKAEVKDFLESNKEEIGICFDHARQSYIDAIMPIWNAHLEVNDAVETWFGGNVGMRRLMHLSHYVTTNTAMLIPEYLRSEKVVRLVPEEVKDQVPNMHLKYRISKETGIPFALLISADIDEDGDILDIHDLITAGPEEDPLLTEWGTAAILALQQEGVDLPDELAELIRLPDSLA